MSTARTIPLSPPVFVPRAVLWVGVGALDDRCDGGWLELLLLVLVLLLGEAEAADEDELAEERNR